MMTFMLKISENGKKDIWVRTWADVSKTMVINPFENLITSGGYIPRNGKGI